jgi:hypothetical protein
MGRHKLIIATLLIAAVATGIGVDWSRPDSAARSLWQQAVVPGDMSGSHAFLSENCAACHAPVKGIEPTRCVACHATNKDLMQRQPTAFHAQVGTCSGCHVEHQGTKRMPTAMDHVLLARIGRAELGARSLGPVEIESAIGFATRSTAELKLQAGPEVPGDGSALKCASCHATKDRHQGMLGSDCVQCHSTSQWSIATFRHPSPRSTECAQCHRPPPSHGMGHFPMMSAPMARQPDAKVEQCYLCHQTTSWNDIKGVGWTKHH